VEVFTVYDGPDFLTKYAIARMDEPSVVHEAEAIQRGAQELQGSDHGFLCGSARCAWLCAGVTS
jgi:hypothetical protein